MLPYLLRNTSKQYLSGSDPLFNVLIFSVFLLFFPFFLLAQSSVAEESSDNALIVQLQHSHGQARGAAAYYLGEKKILTPNAKFALLLATKDSSEEVRATVVRALAKHQVPEGLSALKRGLQLSSWPLILDYLEAFTTYGAVAVSLTDTCLLLFAHKRKDVREAAAKALGKIGPIVIPTLLRAIEQVGQTDQLDTTQGKIARNSFRALSYMGNQAQAAIPTLQALPYEENTALALLRETTLLHMDLEVSSR